MNLKFGKLAPRHDPRTLKFSRYRRPSLIQVPATFGHSDRIADWGMLGNDQQGDCVWAGAAHEEMLRNACAGRGVAFNDDGVLADYHAVAGPEDAGTNVLDAMNYRRQTGVVDAGGVRHRIDAFVALGTGNLTELKEAVYLFGCVGIGIRMPSYAIDQFDAGVAWTARADAQIEGGHYVSVIGWEKNDLLVVTWGRVQRMSQGFFREYNDESIATLSKEYCGDDGKTIDGFDMDLLQADLDLIA